MPSNILLSNIGGAVRDGMKIIGQTGVFPAPLIALFTNPVIPIPSKVTTKSVATPSPTPAPPAPAATPYTGVTSTSASDLKRSSGPISSVASMAVHPSQVSSAPITASSSLPAVTRMCDGHTTGYYREELLNTPVLLGVGGICVFCGHTAALHPRKPLPKQ